MIVAGPLFRTTAMRSHGLMVLLVAATAYPIGLQPALFVAVFAWAISRARRARAQARQRRLVAFRDNWSRRFHRDLFEPSLRNGRRPAVRV